ncbi:MAG: ATP-binding protein [DPANN group archaeon]|nr:ATP-binding protein [DPANN group archaeon]
MAEFVNIQENDIKTIKYLLNYFKKDNDSTLLSKSYLFFGTPGIGKTTLVKDIITSMNEDIIYMAWRQLNLKNATKVDTFEKLNELANNNKKQIIFIDDINILLEKNEFDVIIPKHQKSIMELLDNVKENANKVLLMTSNNIDFFEMPILDRIEITINFDLPSEKNKLNFINSKYSKYITPENISFIIKNSIGYNYRDLSEMIKFSWRINDKKITNKSLKRALHTCKPKGLHTFDIHHQIDTNLKDIIGKDKAVQLVNRLSLLQKNEKLKQNLGIRRNNLILFHGPPGTGKTFMVKAISGELKIPIINISTKEILGGNVYRTLDIIAEIAKTHKDYIIFIDEADKIMGGNMFDEDNSLVGSFQAVLDNIDSKEIQALLILSVNNPKRFGKAFRDRFVNIPFLLPNFEERLIFLENKIKTAKAHIKLDIESSYIAEETENMSYRDMDRIWNDLMFYALENDEPITNDTFDEIMGASKKKIVNCIVD